MLVIYLQSILYKEGVFNSARYRVTPTCIHTQVLTKKVFGRGDFVLLADNMFSSDSYFFFSGFWDVLIVAVFI